ncbi:MAG: sodium:solute symporter [Bacillota bacterium]|nr:sodium:solute symporter [Bacillota bacterium]
MGLYCRKHSSNVGDFVLGGREVGPWLTAFAYGTSYFSSVVFVGYAGHFGWNFGVSVLWIGIGNAIIGSLMAWNLLGRRTRVMTKHLEAATMPDFFSKRYNSKALKIAASVIIFIFLVPYSASVYKGLSGLFSLSFGISFNYCILGIAVLTAVYVIAGGYMATALNDLIQGIIMILGISLVIYCVLDGKGGFMAAFEQLSQFQSEAAPGLQGPFVSIFGPDPLGLLSVVILTSVGTWGLPQMVHKFYTIKNEKAIHTGTIISTVFALIIAGGSYFIGSFGRLYYPAGGEVVYDEVVPAMLANSLPDLLIGVVLILVLSASMSTLSSLVITSSSTFTLDFLKGIFFKNMSPKTQVALIKSLCGAFILLSVIIAMNPNNLITTLMSISWGALAGAFLGPFLYGLFWRKATKASVWVSFAVGIGITAANFFLNFTTPIAAGAFAIVSSFFVVPLVSLFTPKLNKDYVQDVFSCYDETVAVSHRFALREDDEDSARAAKKG